MTAAPELHHPVLVAGLPAAGSDVTVRADAAQRAAIADRLRIPAVARLVCRYHLVPGQDGMVMARGVLEAEVTQVGTNSASASCRCAVKTTHPNCWTTPSRMMKSSMKAA